MTFLSKLISKPYLSITNPLLSQVQVISSPLLSMAALSVEHLKVMAASRACFRILSLWSSASGPYGRAPKGDGGQSSLLSHPLPMVERLRTLSVEHLLDHFQNRLKSHLRAFYSHFKRPKLVRIAYLLWGQV